MIPKFAIFYGKELKEFHGHVVKFLYRTVKKVKVTPISQFNPKYPPPAPRPPTKTLRCGSLGLPTPPLEATFPLKDPFGKNNELGSIEETLNAFYTLECFEPQHLIIRIEDNLELSLLNTLGVPIQNEALP